MDEVKYKKGDIVLFRYGQKTKSGTIVIVDAHGTFCQLTIKCNFTGSRNISDRLPLLLKISVKNFSENF